MRKHPKRVRRTSTHNDSTSKGWKICPNNEKCSSYEGFKIFVRKHNSTSAIEFQNKMSPIKDYIFETCHGSTSTDTI
jgi:hypothetical protein